MSEKAPRVDVVREHVPGQATAATDSTIILSEAPTAATVTEVSYTPDAVITGVNSNTRRVALINRGQAGAGTTVVAELQFDAGVNATAGDEKPITLSVVAGATTLAAGDILAWFSDAIGTGIVDPGGLVQVSLSRS
jgi:hypothetical protein